ncbi:ABC transporter substrate-binding protein, partial [Dyella sp.]|uniref:ABC transporter substrate-binding protein n=1 Tax=Dyella sp. TaxID=1869338 RepID=UPI00284F96B6
RPLGEYACAQTNTCRGSDRWALFRYAIERVNADPLLLPDTQLLFELIDDQNSAAEGFFAADQLIDRLKARVLIGPAQSTPAANAALVGKKFNTPVLSYSASSPTLSNKNQYPTFFRTCQQDQAQGEAIAWFMRYQFEWHHAAILYTSDAYGTAGSSIFLAAADRYNISVLADQSFPIGATAADLDQPLRRIKASRATVIVYFGQQLEWASVVVKGAELGLFNNATAWFGSDAVWSSNADVNNPTIRLQRERTNGLLVLTPDSGFGTPTFNSFARDFMARDTSHLHPLEIFQPNRPEDIGYYPTFAADAVFVLVHALHDLFYQRGLVNFTHDDLLDAIQRVNFTGISGQVGFDANQDRVGTRWVLQNQQGLEWKRMGVYAEHQFTASADAGPILWADGTANIPLSEPLPPRPMFVVAQKVTRGLVICILLLCALALFGILLAAIGMYLTRAMRVMHTASPRLLVCVLVGGALAIVSAMLSPLVQTPVICTWYQWLLHISHQLVFGSILLRAWRVKVIFLNPLLRNFMLSDVVLLRYLACLVAADILLLAAMTGFAPFVVDPTGICVASGDPRVYDVLEMCLLVPKFLLLVYSAYLSWAIRHTSSMYGSRYLSVAIHNALISYVAFVGYKASTDQRSDVASKAVLGSFVTLFVMSLVLVLSFAPKFRDVWQAEKNGMWLEKEWRKAGREKRRPKAEGRTTSSPKNPQATTNGSGGGGGGSGGDIPSHHSSPSLSSTASTPEARAAAAAARVEAREAFTAAMQEQTRYLEETYAEIRAHRERTKERRQEIRRCTDNVFQLACELDYFEKVSDEMDAASIRDFTDERLKDFAFVPTGGTSWMPLPAAVVAAAPKSPYHQNGSDVDVSDLVQLGSDGNVRLGGMEAVRGGERPIRHAPQRHLRTASTPQPLEHVICVVPPPPGNGPPTAAATTAAALPAGVSAKDPRGSHFESKPSQASSQVVVGYSMNTIGRRGGASSPVAPALASDVALDVGPPPLALADLRRPLPSPPTTRRAGSPSGGGGAAGSGARTRMKMSSRSPSFASLTLLPEPVKEDPDAELAAMCPSPTLNRNLRIEIPSAIGGSAAADPSADGPPTKTDAAAAAAVDGDVPFAVGASSESAAPAVPAGEGAAAAAVGASIASPTELASGELEGDFPSRTSASSFSVSVAGGVVAACASGTPSLGVSPIPDRPTSYRLLPLSPTSPSASRMGLHRPFALLHIDPSAAVAAAALPASGVVDLDPPSSSSVVQYSPSGSLSPRLLRVHVDAHVGSSLRALTPSPSSSRSPATSTATTPLPSPSCESPRCRAMEMHQAHTHSGTDVLLHPWSA